MSKHSSERRSYSVDEMMDRLRDGEREKRERDEGEWVTRPDGTRVLKIRRRKRRSKQPHKTKKVRMQRTGTFAMIVALLGVVALAVTAVLLMARFNSKGYREQMKEELLASTGAQAGISDLSVVPFRARAKSIELQWSGHEVLKSLKLDRINAPLNVSSFLGAGWSGDVVSIESGMLVLGTPTQSGGAVVADGDFPFDYESYRCSKFDLEFESGSTVRVSDSEVTMRPQAAGGVQFIINGGRLLVPSQGELRISNGLARLGEDGFELISLRLPSPDRGDDFANGADGEATLSTPEKRPMRSVGGAELEIELVNFSLSEVLGGSLEGLGQIFGGVVNTREGSPGTIVFDPRNPGGASLEVPFEGDEGTLGRLTFLHSLSGIFRNSEYDQPTQGAVSGVLQRDSEGVRLRDFTFESKTLLRLEGNVDLASDGSLSGTIRLGVPEGLIPVNSVARQHTIFSEVGQGHRWITITLSGSIDRPVDNFQALMNQAVEPSGARPAAEDILEDAFQRLTEEPGEGEEPAEPEE